MQYVLYAVLALTIAAVGVRPAVAPAQSVPPWENKILADNCAEGKQLVRLELQADQLIARNDPLDGYSVPLKAAAKVAYNCAEATNNAYAKDWYVFSFANDSFRGVSSEAEAERVWPPMVHIFSVLTRSPHNDVRQAAANALSLAQAAENRAGIH